MFALFPDDTVLMLIQDNFNQGYHKFLKII